MPVSDYGKEYQTDMSEPEQPIVSAVIPCYNHGDYLVAAINSVFHSTHPAVEVVVVNDGSDDKKTLSVLSGLENHPNIQVVHQKNRGPSAARNVGISAARGEYILTLDADDKIAPTFIEQALSRLEKDESLGFAYSDVRMVGEGSYVRKLPDYNFYQLLWDCIVVSCVLARKEAFLSVGGYDKGMRNGFEDWELWIRLAKKGWHGIRIPEPLYEYHTERGEMMRLAREQHNKNVSYIRQKHGDIYNDRENMSEIRQEWLPSASRFWLKLWVKRVARTVPYPIYKRLKYAYHSTRHYF